MITRTSINWKAWGLIAFLGLIAFIPTLRLGFLLDDHKLIGDNPRMREWSSANVTHDFMSNVFDDPNEDPYYRPLLTLSDRVDFSLWQGHPAGFHFTNIIFHVLSCLLLFHLFLAISFSRRVSLISTSLFAVHPLLSDVFLLVTARGEQMAMAFSLAVILGLLKPPGRQWFWILPVYALALFSKESAVMTPFCAALVFAYRRDPLTAYARLIPLLVLNVPYLLLRHHVVGPISHAPLDMVLRFSIEAFPRQLWIYVAHGLVPLELHFPRQILPLSHWWGVILAVSLMGVIGILWRAPRWSRWCLGWFVVNMLPKASSMVSTGFALDHWVYASLPALMLPVGIAIDAGLRSDRESRRKLSGFTWFGVVAIFIALCWMNASVRGTDEKALRWALPYEHLYSLRFKLGVLLWQQGRAAEAEPYLISANQHEPDNVSYGNALALDEWALGHHDQAIALMQSVVHAHPQDPMSQHNWTEMQKRR